MPDVITATQQYQAALDRESQREMRALIDEYTRMYKRLQDKIDLLVLSAGGRPMTEAQIYRLDRYQDLTRQIEQELIEYQSLVTRTTRATVDSGLVSGERDARRLLSVTVGGDESIVARFNRLPVGAIKTLTGFLDDDSDLYKRIKLLAPTTFDIVRQRMIEGIGLGYNPKKIARMIQDGFGQGLTDALRTVRTAQIWAYREANRAVYTANSDVVKGWVWYAALDDLTCMSCVAQHGSEHPLDEPLDDHYNGRCVALPLTVFGNPVDEKGVSWFEKMGEVQQRAMMGTGKYEAWKAGQFDVSQMSAQRPVDVYGNMHFEASMKELLG